MKPTVRVAIDKERCQGHARCHVAAPQLFNLDVRGFGEVEGDGMCSSPQAIEAARRAAAACPERAVRLED